MRFFRLSVLLAGFLLAACSDDYLLDHQGHKIFASGLNGRWLIINYWADWCPPCRTEIPELNKLAKAELLKDYWVLGVNYDGLQGDDLRRVVDQLDINFKVLADDPASYYELPHSNALPTTFILDPQGKLRDQLQGEQTADSIMERLSALKAELK